MCKLQLQPTHPQYVLIQVCELRSAKCNVGQLGGQMSLHFALQICGHAQLHSLHFLRRTRALLHDARKWLRGLNPQLTDIVMMAQQMWYIEVLQVRVGGQLEGAQVGQRVEAAILEVVQTEIGYIQHFQVLINAVEAVVVQ